jgi:hypothetical protein
MVRVSHDGLGGSDLETREGESGIRVCEREGGREREVYRGDL